jgi:hypothetical protein
MRKVPVADRCARLYGILQQQKQLARRFNIFSLAFKLDPFVSRSRLDTELLLNRLKVSRVVIVKLLRYARIFKM